MTTDTNPTKAYPYKKLAPLEPFESDTVRTLVMEVAAAQAAYELREKQLIDYCNHVIARKGQDPQFAAIDPTLQFVIELPAEKLAMAVAQKAAAQQLEVVK